MNTQTASRYLPAFHCLLIAVAFTLASIRFFITDSHDRYQCHALLNDGQWLDAGLSNDKALQNWQPDGCMLHSYSEKTAKKCLDKRRVIFVGDSIVRQLYYEVASLIDGSVKAPNYATGANADPELKHQDIQIMTKGPEVKMIWDPYLNSTKLYDLLKYPRGKGKKDQIPALLVLGTGLWQLRNPASGGLPAWEQSIDQVFKATSTIHEQIADEVILLPVQKVVPEMLNPDRRKTLSNDLVDKMNAKLMEKLPPHSEKTSTISQLSIPYVFNDMLAYPQVKHHSPDGLHFEDAILRARANILLNLRCNDVLPKQFTFDKTCCNQYPAPNWLQAIILLVTLVWAPLGTHYYASKGNPFWARFLPAPHVLPAMTIFGFSVIFMYFTDRTSLFLKIQKQFDFWQFTVAMVLAVILGLGTMKKPEKDLGFLNRDQTDEWKGWMQIAILIYHYYGASKISGVYNPIRVLVAAYLFMSGYGHFFFYYKKADFGLARIAAVLIRLNLLTIVLTYIQDTDYLSYYFSPLTTLWFGVIWVTMYIGNQYNKNVAFMLGKIAVSAALMSAFHLLNWPLSALFAIYNTLFGTQWNSREWTFRVTLDMFIVYVGMLAAFAFIKITDYKLWERSWWINARRYTIVLAAIGMIGYFYFELQFNKLEYNRYHPFVSMVPVLSFIVLRNATPLLRSTSSRAYIWIGQCSLETFICQFHLWLAGDTKGLLVLLPFPRWRMANMLFTTLIFLFISNQISNATGELTDWLCGKAPKSSGSKKPVATSNGNGHSAGAGGGGVYIPLAQVDVSETAANGHGNGDIAQSGLSHEGDAAGDALPAPVPQRPNRFTQALKSLPARCMFIMGIIWVINILYPIAHPSQGHLMPLHH